MTKARGRLVAMPLHMFWFGRCILLQVRLRLFVCLIVPVCSSVFWSARREGARVEVLLNRLVPYTVCMAGQGSRALSVKALCCPACSFFASQHSPCFWAGGSVHGAGGGGGGGDGG
ncbi:hypothetical protein PLESTM_001570100 [Pleodorina starrii]|nr:hypothetical protein PLESTM_001570100 [Pleodorina starrii]